MKLGIEMRCFLRFWFVALVVGCSYNQSKKVISPLNEDDFFKVEELQSDDFFEDTDEEKASDETLKDIPCQFKQKVSLSFGKKINLEEVIIRLSNMINVNIQINCDINSKVYINVKDQPYINVIKNICDQNNLRYKIENGVIYIDKDVPYTKTYNLQFLNILRKSNSSISTNTDIFSKNSSNNGDNNVSSTDNGSSNNVVNSDSSDFWNELENNLKNFVTSKISIHKQAGLITVKGTSKEHDLVKKYLDKIIKVVNSQVTIEAKILELSLNKEYMHGIDWNFTRKLSSSLTQFSPTHDNNESGIFAIGIKSKNLNGFIKFIEKFGAVKTLSSPRITVMNNQTAILKVAKQEVYFNLVYNNNSNYGYNYRLNRDLVGNNEVFYSNINTVPVGVVLSVHPVIDVDTGRITMTLRPSISKIVGFKFDPSIAMNWNAKRSSLSEPPKSSVPIVEVREIDSVLNTRSDEVIMLGGLMQDMSESNNSDNFFGIVKNSNLQNNLLNRNLTEIIILLKAKIVKNKKDYVKSKDKKLYKKYSSTLKGENNDKKN